MPASAAPNPPINNQSARRYPRTRGRHTAREMPSLLRLCFVVMTVELRHLRAFVAIAAEGTITRAAARLHVTQPALSRTLRQLEAHLGARLIDRSTHHLQLTAAGHAVGVTTTATAATYPSPAVAYLPFIDVPAVTVHLAWKQPPSHPAVPDFIALARLLIPTPHGTTATA
jgi:hypothetical protein